jgi:hypothetical protein
LLLLFGEIKLKKWVKDLINNKKCKKINTLNNNKGKKEYASSAATVCQVRLTMPARQRQAASPKKLSTCNNTSSDSLHAAVHLQFVQTLVFGL